MVSIGSCNFDYWCYKYAFMWKPDSFSIAICFPLICCDYTFNKKENKNKLACVIVYSIMFVQLGNNRQYKGIFEYVQSAVFFWDDSYSQKAAIGGSNTDMRQRQLEEAIRLMNTNPIAGIGLDYQYYSIDHHPNSILLGFESILLRN